MPTKNDSPKKYEITKMTMWPWVPVKDKIIILKKLNKKIFKKCISNLAFVVVISLFSLFFSPLNANHSRIIFD